MRSLIGGGSAPAACAAGLFLVKSQCFLNPLLGCLGEGSGRCAPLGFAQTVLGKIAMWLLGKIFHEFCPLSCCTVPLVLKSKSKCMYRNQYRNQSGCELAKNVGFLPFIRWVFLTNYIFVALMKITMCFKQLEASHIMPWDS